MLSRVDRLSCTQSRPLLRVQRSFVAGGSAFEGVRLLTCPEMLSSSPSSYPSSFCRMRVSTRSASALPRLPTLPASVPIRAVASVALDRPVCAVSCTHTDTRTVRSRPQPHSSTSLRPEPRYDKREERAGVVYSKAEACETSWLILTAEVMICIEAAGFVSAEQVRTVTVRQLISVLESSGSVTEGWRGSPRRRRPAPARRRPRRPPAAWTRPRW